MNFFENWKTLIRWEIPERRKKIVITVAVITLVLLFFLWLECGLLSTASEEKKKLLLPISFMYAVFPALTLIFGGTRIYRILSGEEPEEKTKTEQETEKQ